MVSARYKSAIAPAFSGKNVLKPTTLGAYSYLYQRKFLLVNGTHTTLAFMTLRCCCTEPSEAPGRHTTACLAFLLISILSLSLSISLFLKGDFELLTPETLPKEAQRELQGWMVARCLVILHSHEIDVLKVRIIMSIMRDTRTHNASVNTKYVVVLVCVFL